MNQKNLPKVEPEISPEIHLSKINPYEGFHVDLVETVMTGSGKPALAIYVYSRWGGDTHEPVELSIVPADDQWAAGNLKRDFMLMEWLCRYANSGGSLDTAADLVSKLAEYVGPLVQNDQLHFLGYKLVTPEGNQYLPSDRDVDPFSPFVYYVCTEGYDLDNVLEVHENKHANWVDYVDLDI